MEYTEPDELDRLAASFNNKIAAESKQMWYMLERAKRTAAAAPKPSVAMIAELKRRMK